MKSNQKGFTLVEILVVMAVFSVVMMISADAFKTILTQSAKVFRSEESNIEGVIGLEIMRHDLQQAGYGLFSENMATAYDGEAAVAPASNYNEALFTTPPRAIVTGNNLAATADSTSEAGNTYNLMAGSDYIAIKGTTVGRSRASQRWTYLKLDAAGSVVPNAWSSAAENFATNEKVVVLRRTLNSTSNTVAVEREPSTGDFYFPFSNAGFVNYSTSYYKYVVYGLATDTSLPRMPYNRSDYFVARPATSGVPGVCAPNTGVLYKTVVNNSVTNGKLTYYPLLDCVADMQVVLMWDLMSGAAAGIDGTVDTYSNADGSAVSGTATIANVQAALADPAAIRNSLKGVKVYILAQNGRLDPAYTSPSPITVGVPGEISLTRNYDINSAGWQHYRWKLYQIVVRPKNLSSNQ